MNCALVAGQGQEGAHGVERQAVDVCSVGPSSQLHQPRRVETRGTENQSPGPNDIFLTLRRCTAWITCCWALGKEQLQGGDL